MDVFEYVGEKYKQRRNGKDRTHASGRKEKMGEQKRERKPKNNSNEQNSGLGSGQPPPHPLPGPIRRVAQTLSDHSGNPRPFP